MSLTSYPVAIQQLHKRLDMDVVDKLFALEKEGWTLQLAPGGFEMSHPDTETISAPLYSDEQVAEFITAKYAELLPGMATATVETSEAPVESEVASDAAPPPPGPAAADHKRQAHEQDLRDKVIKHLESQSYSFTPDELHKSEGYGMRRDVECKDGIAEIVTGDAIYEMACSITEETFTALALKVEAFVEEIDRTADGVIITCCSEQVEKLDDLGKSYGVRVQTFEQFIAPPEKLPVEDAAPMSGDTLFPESESGAGSNILVQQVLPSKLSTHPSLLMRANGLDHDHVAELEAGYRAGKTYPPADVFFDGEKLWLADGNHRAAGAARAGAPVDIREHKGTLRDAILFALRANTEHGLKLTNDDKRLKVVTILSDKDWFKESDTRLAGIGSVTQPFISSVRRDLALILPALQNDESQLDEEEVGKRLGVSAGLVHIVRSLPEDGLEALTQNVLSDDGRRRGSDGVVRSVPSKSNADDAATLPLPLEAETTVPSADLQPVEAVSERTTLELAQLLKAYPDGLHEEALIDRGFTKEQIVDARTQRLVERHENGRCYYVWTPSDIVVAITERGRAMTQLELDELGCQRYAVNKAEAEGFVSRNEQSSFVAVARNVTLAEEAEKDVQTEDLVETATALPPFDASFGVTMTNAGWEMKRDGRKFHATNQKLQMATILYDTAQQVIDDAVKQQGRYEQDQKDKAQKLAAKAQPTLEELLGGKGLKIGIVWASVFEGQISVSVNIGDDPANSLREFIPVSDLKPLPEALTRMITQQVEAVSKTNGSTGKKAATKKSSATASTSSKKSPAKKPAQTASKKSAAKKPAAKTSPSKTSRVKK